MNWEIDFLKYIIENIHNDTMTFVMTMITSMGNYGFIWILTAILFLVFKKTRNIGVIESISLVSVFILVNVIIKPIVDRARPFEISLDILNNVLISLPGDGSFPSGHTAAAFAASTAVFCCNRKYGAYMLVLAVLMGLSRLYFAVHFPTDVMAGLVIGIVIGILSYKIVKKIKKF